MTLPHQTASQQRQGLRRSDRRSSRSRPPPQGLKAKDAGRFRAFRESLLRSRAISRSSSCPSSNNKACSCLGRKLSSRTNRRTVRAFYVEQIEEPLASLFALKLAIFLLDERRDVLLRNDGFLKPERPYIDDWRIRYFLVVPRHGCFRMNPSAPLHRFNETCAAAGDAVFHAVKNQDVGLHVFANALVAYSETINWCDVCFPVLADGSRISLEYMEQITGLRRDQWYALYEAATGEEYLNGLA